MKLDTPTDQTTLDARFGYGDGDDDHVTPLGDVDDPRFWRTVNILREHIGDDHTLTLARDWEGCVFGMVDVEPGSKVLCDDVLAFTHDGHVGSGGVNMPNYMDPMDYLGKKGLA